MVRFFYLHRNIWLCNKIQHLLLHVIDIIGEEAEIKSGVPFGEFQRRMKKTYIKGLYGVKSISEQKDHYKVLSDMKDELERLKQKLNNSVHIKGY